MEKLFKRKWINDLSLNKHDLLKIYKRLNLNDRLEIESAMDCFNEKSYDNLDDFSIFDKSDFFRAGAVSALLLLQKSMEKKLCTKNKIKEVTL
jgi:hypothetical protein